MSIISSTKHIYLYKLWKIFDICIFIYLYKYIDLCTNCYLKSWIFLNKLQYFSLLTITDPENIEAGELQRKLEMLNNIMDQEARAEQARRQMQYFGHCKYRTYKRQFFIFIIVLHWILKLISFLHISFLLLLLLYFGNYFTAQTKQPIKKK